jgi:hypothetical protein
LVRNTTTKQKRESIETLRWQHFVALTLPFSLLFSLSIFLPSAGGASPAPALRKKMEREKRRERKGVGRGRARVAAICQSTKTEFHKIWKSQHGLDCVMAREEKLPALRVIKTQKKRRL